VTSASISSSLHFDSARQPSLPKRVLGWSAIAIVHCALFAWLWFSPEPAPTQPAQHAMMVTFVAEQLPVAVRQPQPVPPVPQTPPKPAPKMIATPNPASTAAITVPPEKAPDAPVQETAPPSPPPSPAAPAATSHEDSVIPPDYLAAYLNNPGPQYPNASRRRREEGVVTLRVLVSATGSPEQVLIEHSSGFAELDNAASSIVKQRWRFAPARQRNVAVSAWVVVPVEFELKKH
jgi:periplasmic protein TonB